MNDFCIGKNLKGNEQIIKRIDAEGHLIGNHSNSHAFWFDFYTKQAMIDDLTTAASKIENILGKKPACFRPPYGVTNPTIRKTVDKLNVHVIGWNIRSMDTAIVEEQKILDRIKKRLKPGAIVLLHDTDPKIVNVLKSFIQYTKEQGYTIVTFDKLLGINAYA